MDEIKRSHSPIVQTNFFEGAKLENGLIKLNGDIYEISYVGMKQGSKIPPKELEKIGNFVLALLKNIKMEASPDALKLTKDRITHLKGKTETNLQINEPQQQSLKNIFNEVFPHSPEMPTKGKKGSKDIDNSRDHRHPSQTKKTNQTSNQPQVSNKQQPPPSHPQKTGETKRQTTNSTTNSTNTSSLEVRKKLIDNSILKTTGTSTNDLLCFYKNGATAFLGNFYPCKIEIFERTFKCAEAAFQWIKHDLVFQEHGKSFDPKILPKFNELMIKLSNAEGEEAYKLNRELDELHGKYPPNWQGNDNKFGIRDLVMWDVLKAKFAQNEDLMELLKHTDGAYLLEHRPSQGRDNYWSDGHDGSGFNMLGKMLMLIEQDLDIRNEKDAEENYKTLAPNPNQLGIYAKHVNEKIIQNEIPSFY